MALAERRPVLLLSEVATTSREVASTRSRRVKVALLADLLRRGESREAELAVGFLTGELRQGKVGIGASTLGRLDESPASSSTLSVADVDQMVDELQSTIGPGSQQRRAALLGRVWSRATAAEQEFLGRLLLGELRQGALEGLMVEAIAAAAEISVAAVRRAAMVSGDVRAVAGLALAGGDEALGGVQLEVGRGILPMLASTAATVADALSRTGRASVERKLDGVRVQVHKRDDEVRVFTRNLNDITARSPEVVAVAHRLDVRHVVLDGEALGLDDEGGPHPFQDSMSRIGTHGITSTSLTLAPFFFDVLHVDGEDLFDRPLSERQRILDAIVPPAMVVPRLVTDEADAALAFLERSVQAGHEGVVVKALGSTYDAGRRGAQWLKVKPVHTFDLVVLAAEWGHGRRRGWLSNLHLGARDPQSGAFVMLGKTFKGLTDEVLAWQTKRLLELERGRTPGVVQVRPELVVEVAIDGVQRSDRYPGGVALRFARVKRYRPDKDPQHADTVDALRAMLPSS